MKEFKSTQFMTAEEKEKVVKNFKKFIASDLDEGSFTKALYNHLHVHCGFIAHYNKDGFYQSRFVGLENLKTTLHGIQRSATECSSDYRDLNTVLSQIVAENYEKIIQVYTKIEISNLEADQRKTNERLASLRK